MSDFLQPFKKLQNYITKSSLSNPDMTQNVHNTRPDGTENGPFYAGNNAASLTVVTGNTQQKAPNQAIHRLDFGSENQMDDIISQRYEYDGQTLTPYQKNAAAWKIIEESL